MKRILVFTPSASRGGSEMSLLNLIRHSDFQKFAFHVIAGQEGRLIDEFREVADVSILPSNKDRKRQITQKILRNAFKYDLDLKFILSVHEKFKADFWYINTSILPNISLLAIESNIPYVVHFHELLSVYDQMKGHTFRKMIESSVLNICCSEKIKSYLDAFPSANNAIFNKQVSLEKLKADALESEKLKKLYGFKKFAFIWVMSGAASPRKGLDLFIEIAKSKPKSGFVWIGKQRDHGYNEVLAQIIDNQGINNIFFINEQDEQYVHFLNCADGFLLTSREDPFPTVMIEAAHLGKPIASFNSGGSSDFIKDKMGFVVEHLNVSALIKKMVEIESNPSSFDIEILKKEASTYNVLTGVKEWEELLQDV